MDRESGPNGGKDMSYQDTFKRFEIKYLLSAKQKREFMKVLEKNMILDSYGRTTIQNIYYDTPDWNLIRTSLEKPVYKEKLRLRSYGSASPEKTVFIEIKKKFKGVVYKRRTSATEREATAYLNHGIKIAGHDDQISREIDYFKNYYEGLKPAMFISYEREAFYGKEDPELRLTLDFNIRARDTDLDLTLGDQGRLLLPKDYVLMEIKVGGAYPLWMTHLLNELEIYGVSFSKYGTGYKQKLAAYLENRKHLTIPGRNTPIAIPGTQPRGVAI